MVITAASLDASHDGTTRRWRNRRRQRGRARAGRGLHRRPAQPGGMPELRAGREHGGDAGRVMLLGAQGRGEEGSGLPLPGLPGQPGLRCHPQHDQGPAAARRLQGQDAPLQQVPPFYSGCDWWVSSPFSVFWGSVLRRVAVVVDTFSGITGWNWQRFHRPSTVPIAFRCSCSVFWSSVLRRVAVVVDTFGGITGWNWQRLHRPSTVPIAFRCSHLPGVHTRLLGDRDSVRVPCPISCAHLFIRPFGLPA